MYQKFTQLRLWKETHELVLEIYKVTASFPNDEKYGIVSQIRWAITSVAANIAEGCERKYQKEFIHFLYIAKGSLSEARYFLLLAHDCGKRESGGDNC